MLCLLSETKYQSHVRVLIRIHGSYPASAWIRTWCVSGSYMVRVCFVSASCVGSRLVRIRVRVLVRISRKLAGLDVNVIMFMLFFFRSRF